MNEPDRFDLSMSAWMAEARTLRAPDGLVTEATAKAANADQRPAWRIPERWIPMRIYVQLAVIPRAVIALVTLGVLTAAMAGAAAIGAGGSPPQAAPPAGPAGNGLIAFASVGDIWVVEPDGSDLRQLTTGPDLETTPVWSRDGTRLAYWSQPGDGAPSSLVVVEADGSRPVAVATDEAGRTSLPPDWSPDGTSLAFTFCQDSPCGEFVVATSDGSGSAGVGSPKLSAYRLKWSPDGTMLAFGGTLDGDEPGVYLMAPDGSEVRRLSQVTSHQENHFSNVEWSPDGTRIATHAGLENPDLWVIEVDGTGEVSLAERAVFPRWSPDGAWLAYQSEGGSFQREPGVGVVVVPSDGGEATLVGPSTGPGVSWSPDATALALPRDVAGGPGLAIVDLASGEVRAEIAGVDGSYSWQRLAP